MGDNFIHTFFFYVIAALTAFSAIGVVVTQNIVRAATWLLFTLAGVAGIFFLLGAYFVGATQLLVYVGGTLILVVFGVMLTAQGPFINMKTSAAEWFISMTVGILLYGVLLLSLTLPTIHEGTVVKVEAGKLTVTDTDKKDHSFNIGGRVKITRASDKENKAVKLDDLKAGDKVKVTQEPMPTYPGAPPLGEELTPTTQIGLALLGAQGDGATSYLLPFEIVSVHLLVVLIGAAYLARTKRRKGATS